MFAMLGWRAGVLLAVLAGIGGLWTYASHQAEARERAEAANAALRTAVQEQGASIQTLRAERDKVADLVASLSARNSELARRAGRVRTVYREVLANDPDAAECGNARLPGAVAQLVREYQAGDGDPGRDPDAASGAPAADPGA